jgi:Zn-finger nucleic acid-binding protein
MKKDRFHPKIPVQIDRCEKCGYIWMDYGEQELIVQLYHEMVQSGDAGVSDKRDEISKMEQLARRKAAGLENVTPVYDPGKDNYTYSIVDPNDLAADGRRIGYLGMWVAQLCDAVMQLIFPRRI